MAAQTRFFRPVMMSPPLGERRQGDSFSAEDGAEALVWARDVAERRNTRLLQLFEVGPDTEEPIAYIPFHDPNRPILIPRGVSRGPVIA